jgi:carbonic anhydrase
VITACSNRELSGYIKLLIDQIKPLVRKGGTANEVIRRNAAAMVKKIQSDKVVLRREVPVIGACYDVHTGEVEWL